MPDTPITDLYGFANVMLAVEPTFAAAPQRLTASGGAAKIAGMAVVPVDGILTPGPSDPKQGTRSYGDIRLELIAALRADDIGKVVLLVNSPGGFVEDCFDLADTIYAARAIKPVHAIITGKAFSAAYALACAAETISVPRTGGTGSVGVVMIHTEFSRAMAQAGVRTTVLRSGDQKMDVNGMEPLTAKALARSQAEVDETAEMLFALVARNRGISVDAVRATGGATIFGEHGRAAGFADFVQAPDAAFRRLLSTN